MRDQEGKEWGLWEAWSNSRKEESGMEGKKGRPFPVGQGTGFSFKTSHSTNYQVLDVELLSNLSPV
jgi:hypothetical protein